MENVVNANVLLELYVTEEKKYLVLMHGDGGGGGAWGICFLLFFF